MGSDTDGMKTISSIDRIVGKPTQVFEGAQGLVEKITIVLLQSPETGTCSCCNKENCELRPFGENGANICFDCGMKDEKGTSQRFLDLFHSAVEAAENHRQHMADINPYPHLSKPNVNG